MNALPVPVRTLAARQRLPQHDGLDALDWTLLGTVDGRRNVVHLESVAKAIGLDAAALTRLEQRGLISYARAPQDEPPRRLPCEYDD